ncbi:MAG: SpaA isopeptide-forming pilin-related protein [Bacteroidaceae bacterium]|nr:SpaA isopeptide-forming pilin-related protein [Bacteroidaceae bacterium]
MKKVMALLLIFALAVSCLPLGAVTAFAAEIDDPQTSTEDATIPSETEEATAPETEPPTETEEPPAEETEPTTAPTEAAEAETEPSATDPATEPTEEPQRTMMFSASPASDDSGSSGSEVGGGGDGSGNTAGDGSSNMIAVGVTMQVVYYRYDDCYNRYNSHGSVINTVQTGKAIPWNDTGKDKGDTMTTVFDTYTITPHTFIVKARWDSYPYVYHFPYENLASDGCTFTWTGFTSFWFNYNNPGGKASTYPRIVRNEDGGSKAIEDYLAHIILGSNYGAWDKLDIAKGETVATDTSLYAATLKYLGASDKAIQNYLDSYHGKLSVSQDGDTLIPTIIWSYVAAENLGGTNRIYTIGDVASSASSNKNWLSTTYTTAANCNAGFETCSWMKKSSDTMICKLMLGGKHSSNPGSTIWKEGGSDKLFGTGLVNRIQTEVDSTAENGTNTFYYLRGYWTPYGKGTGSISLTKTNTAGTANLTGAEFTLYRDPACTTPVTSADYSSLSTSDTGYVSASVRKTDANGKCQWTGLYSGTYFMLETKAPEGYKVNVDSSGKVEVKEVPVGVKTTDITLTNAENSKPVSLKKSINASQSCIDQIKNNSLYSLAGAEYTVSLNGKVVETLVTDASGNATSTKQYNIGDVLTIKETKAPKGYKLDTKTYTHTVTSGENLISVSDIPIFDPPFVLTKVDKDTTTPQGDATFSGAVFKWEYFPNDDWSSTPTRVWYFATDTSGRCVYSKDYLAPGYTSDALYVSPANVNQLPLGTVKITEVKNSLGYTVIASSLYCTIAEDSTKASGAKHIWTEESKAILMQMANGDWGVYEPIDINLFGSVAIDKFDAVTGQTPQGEASLAGAVYEVVNSSANPVKVEGKIYAPGDVICELTTDAKGHAQTGNIFPVGTYTIRESSASPGYLLNTQWQKNFSVTTEKKDHSFSYTDGSGCPETVISGKIQLSKKIVNTIDNLSVPEVGAEFSVTDSKGIVVDTIVTGADGIGTSKELPYGTYTVKQISGQAGTIFCDAWDVTVDEHGKVYKYEKENPLWTASVSLHKKEAGVETPLIGTFELCERTADGTVKILETGTTGADGNLAFTRKIVYTDGTCNSSTYFIREKEAPAGYVLDTNEYPVSCTENQQTISVTIENAPILGKLELRKQSSVGKPMQGVEFVLEFSLDDGSTWSAVTYRENDTIIIPGSCTNAELIDGKLLTDENGIAVYEGLRVYTADGKAILYRVTETKTLDGSSLIPGHIWEGDLVTEKEGEHQFEVVLRVTNSPVLEIPETGSHAAILMPVSLVVCLAACIGALVYLRRKEQ